MDLFTQSRLPPELFQIEDVEGDNACFYRSVANCLGLRTEYDQCDDIIASFNFQHTRPGGVTAHYGNCNWGYNGDCQDNLARNLQEMAYQWVQQNHHKTIEWDFPLSTEVSTYDRERDDDTSQELKLEVATLINLTHEIAYEEYLENYQYYAGDPVVDENDMIVPDRWGGFVEQIALSNIFKMPIVVLVAQRYDTKTNKINAGRISNNKAYRDVMFKTFQITGKEYRDTDPIYLLWKKTRHGPHYMALYPKNPVETNRLCQERLML